MVQQWNIATLMLMNLSVHWTAVSELFFLSANTYYHVQACDVAAAVVVAAAANDSDSIDVVFVAAAVF